jgi:hypothetical protein
MSSAVPAFITKPSKGTLVDPTITVWSAGVAAAEMVKEPWPRDISLLSTDKPLSQIVAAEEAPALIMVSVLLDIVTFTVVALEFEGMSTTTLIVTISEAATVILPLKEAVDIGVL